MLPVFKPFLKYRTLIVGTRPLRFTLIVLLNLSSLKADITHLFNKKSTKTMLCLSYLIISKLRVLFSLHNDYTGIDSEIFNIFLDKAL